jgi:hypothetical protein
MNAIFRQLREDPLAMLTVPYAESFELTKGERHEVQLAGTRRRFAELKSKVAALGRLAEEQGVDEIRDLDDVVPVLFQHTAFKSYPLNFLERSRFDALTRWLGGMTSTDLSGVDASGIDSIDGWLQYLDTHTSMKINHTFGTTGKLSFIPRTKQEWRNIVVLQCRALRDWSGPDTGPDVLSHNMPLIGATYRHGFSTTLRVLDERVQVVAGGDHNSLFLYPDGILSADLASLAGRLRAAEAQGDEGMLRLSPTLLRRREEFAAAEESRSEAMAIFLQQAIERYQGRDVFVSAFWPALYDFAVDAIAHGAKGIFGKNSVLMTGGGVKGRTFPDGWREKIAEVLGFSHYYNTFGMSELSAACNACVHGNYHFPVISVPFVLDLDTGRPKPREGTQTGRLAVMDLLASTYWGGIISGDLVTVSGWDEPCDCGRSGPYMHPDIRRVADLAGGEDKINCAGAPAAHDKALDFLVARIAQ